MRGWYWPTSCHAEAARMCHFGTRIITLWPVELRSSAIQVVTIIGTIYRRTIVQFNRTALHDLQANFHCLSSHFFRDFYPTSSLSFFFFFRSSRNSPRGRSNSQLWHEYFLLSFFLFTRQRSRLWRKIYDGNYEVVITSTSIRPTYIYAAALLLEE